MWFELFVLLRWEGVGGHLVLVCPGVLRIQGAVNVSRADVIGMLLAYDCSFYIVVGFP